MTSTPVWTEHLDHGHVFGWSAPDLPPEAFTPTVVAVLETLAPLYVPLSIEARRACTSRDDGWIEAVQHVSPEGVMLCAARRDVVARRMYVGEHVDEIDRITSSVLAEWLRGLEGECAEDPGHVRRWTELWLESCAVRLVAPSIAAGARVGVRAAERPGETHELVVEDVGGERWIAAPSAALRRALVAAPIAVRFTNGHGLLRMTLDARWSLHSGATPEGDALRAVLAELDRHHLVPAHRGAE